MKPIELLNLWSSFKPLLDDQFLSTEAKVAVAKEVLAALPDPLLCHSALSTLQAVKTVIGGRLQDLEKQHDVERKSRQPEPTPKEETRGEEGVETRKPKGKAKG